MPDSVTAPRFAVAILNFFSSQPDFAAVIGDITEEFHQRVQSSGASAARLWYWREAFRNAFTLTFRELAQRPAKTFLVALACEVGVSAITALYGLSLRALGDPEIIFVHPARLFLIQALSASILGWIGARILRGREWALALMYAFASACWSVVGLAIVITVLLIPLYNLFYQPLRARGLWMIGSRVVAFGLGCMWARKSKLQEGDVNIFKSVLAGLARAGLAMIGLMNSETLASFGKNFTWRSGIWGAFFRSYPLWFWLAAAIGFAAGFTWIFGRSRRKSRS